MISGSQVATLPLTLSTIILGTFIMYEQMLRFVGRMKGHILLRGQPPLQLLFSVVSPFLLFQLYFPVVYNREEFRAVCIHELIYEGVDESLLCAIQSRLTKYLGSALHNPLGIGLW